MRSPVPRAVLVAAALLALGAHAPRAAAQANDVEAKQEYDLGYQALQDGRYQAAVDHYQRSYELVPRPRTLFNLALAEDLLGRVEDAVRHYTQFVELAEPRDAEFVAQAKAKIDALSPRLASAAAPPPTSPTPSSSPEPTPVPGPAAAIARSSGPCEPAHAVLRVRSNLAGATVTVDGVVIGATVDLGDGPTLRYPLAAGEHEIVVERAGAATWHQRLAAADDEVLDVGVELGRSGGARARAATWGLAGLGVVSIAAGGTLGVLALRDAASPDLDRHARGKTRALVTDALLLVGGAALYGASRLAPDASIRVTVRSAPSAAEAAR